jgi:hypothetical protein
VADSHDHDPGEHHETGHDPQSGAEASREVLHPALDVRPRESAQIAEGVDQRDPGGSSGAAQERGRKLPHHRKRGKYGGRANRYRGHHQEHGVQVQRAGHCCGADEDRKGDVQDPLIRMVGVTRVEEHGHGRDAIWNGGN